MNQDIKLDYETCKSIASKYKTKHEFKKSEKFVYQYSENNGWLKDWFMKSNRFGKPRNNFSEEEIIEVSKTCKTREDFREKRPDLYKSAANRGILDMLFPDSNIPELTYDECKAAASLFKNRTEFRLGARKEWNKAKFEKWLDEFFPLYTKQKLYGIKVSNRELLRKACEHAARKYEYIENFKKHEPDNYRIAVQNNFLQEFDWLKDSKWKPNNVDQK